MIETYDLVHVVRGFIRSSDVRVTRTVPRVEILSRKKQKVRILLKILLKIIPKNSTYPFAPANR